MGDGDKGDGKTVIPKLLNAEELARQLGIGLPVIYRLVRAGGLPAVRVGGAVRFLPEQVTAWLERGGSKSTRRVRRRPVIDESAPAQKPARK